MVLNLQCKTVICYTHDFSLPIISMKWKSIYSRLRTHSLYISKIFWCFYPYIQCYILLFIIQRDTASCNSDNLRIFNILSRGVFRRRSSIYDKDFNYGEPLIISAKSSILDIRLGSEYASAQSCNILFVNILFNIPVTFLGICEVRNSLVTKSI